MFYIVKVSAPRAAKTAVVWAKDRRTAALKMGAIMQVIGDNVAQSIGSARVYGMGMNEFLIRWRSAETVTILD